MHSLMFLGQQTKNIDVYLFIVYAFIEFVVPRYQDPKGKAWKRKDSPKTEETAS